MFLVCGEALMDVFATGETPVGVALDARVGGSPFNVAVGLARLRQPVAFASGISTDAFGQRLLRALQAEGVDTSTVQRQVAGTTLSVVSADERGVPTYAFHGEHGADRLLDPRALEALPATTQVLQFGSYAMVVEPVASALRLLVEREHGRRFIAYDPNVRLNVEPAVPRWRAAVEWMAQRAQLLKISAEDAALLYPDEQLEALARRWLAQGVSLVVITCGDLGSVAFTARESVRADAVPITLVDTVGAGDSFQAALLTWLAERELFCPRELQSLPSEDLRAALQFASRAAAITCSRRGADLPRREELDRA